MFSNPLNLATVMNFLLCYKLEWLWNTRTHAGSGQGNIVLSFCIIVYKEIADFSHNERCDTVHKFSYLQSPAIVASHYTMQQNSRTMYELHKSLNVVRAGSIMQYVWYIINYISRLQAFMTLEVNCCCHRDLRLRVSVILWRRVIHLLTWTYKTTWRH